MYTFYSIKRKNRSICSNNRVPASPVQIQITSETRQSHILFISTSCEWFNRRIKNPGTGCHSDYGQWQDADEETHANEDKVHTAGDFKICRFQLSS